MNDLTLPTPCVLENQLKFLFSHFYVVPFEAAQSVKIKI